MPDKISGYYECGFCSKNYKIKKAYDKHYLLCSIINKSVSERKNENDLSENIPSVREMYNIIQILIVKNDRLERQVEKMSSWIHNNKKKVNVIEWLNENIVPSIEYNSWVDSIEINEDDMNRVTNYGFIEGIHQIIKRILRLDSTCDHSPENMNIPIKAFEQKDTMFVFNNEKQWNVITVEQFDMIFDKLTRGLIGQLKIWQDANKKRLFDNGFTEKYIENIKKLTGGDLTRDQQYYKIKQLFYNSLKINIKNIIQYEFVF